MKKIILLGILGFLVSANAHAQSLEHVNGYMKRDGSYVSPYYRTSPDGNPYNNYGSQYNGH